MKKTVLITGASGGIGESASILFGNRGFRVVLNCKEHKEKALKIAKGLPDADVYQADITDRLSVKEMIKNVNQRYGNIDILVLSAGIAQQRLFLDITEKEWDMMMKTHLYSAYYLVQETLPSMIHHKSGKIIFVSSIWGMVGASCEVHYSVAKAGLIGFTKALAKELAPSNIQVNCVAPGFIETPMNDSLSEEEKREFITAIPADRAGLPEEVAQTIFFLASSESNYITGQVISPNGGLIT